MGCRHYTRTMECDRMQLNGMYSNEMLYDSILCRRSRPTGQCEEKHSHGRLRFMLKEIQTVQVNQQVIATGFYIKGERNVSNEKENCFLLLSKPTQNVLS